FKELAGSRPFLPLSELCTIEEATVVESEVSGQDVEGEVHPDGAKHPIKPVVKLYERCLITCANYSEYWIRYVLFMEASGSMDLANNTLARAAQVFAKRQPDIHLFAARFKEQNGDIPGSRAAYQLLHSEICPRLLKVAIKHTNMEYRHGNKEDAFSSCEQAIATENGKEQSQLLPMLFVQYSRFLYLGEADLAIFPFICYKRLNKDYMQKDPEVIVLDPPDAIDVHNRQSMLQDVADQNLSESYGNSVNTFLNTIFFLKSIA
ncbi:hypothetical protein GIB67_000501, partial [Kingdonia uniflora]